MKVVKIKVEDWIPQKGHYVRLVKGQTPMEVMEVFPPDDEEGEAFIRCRYDSSIGHSTYYRQAEKSSVAKRKLSDFVPCTEYAQQLKFNRYKYEEKIVMADLYTWEGKDGGVMYGTKMAQNSLGEFVLEVKGGNGQPIAMSPKLLTKVVPHTIQIQLIRLDGTAGKGASRHIQINKGVLVEGDVFLWGGGVHSVLKDDTKDESAKKLSGKIIKLETQLIDLNKE